jgi:hypothetical protein
MAQLIVRNLDEALAQALKLRAAKRLKALLLEMPAVGDDADFSRPRDLGRRSRL